MLKITKNTIKIGPVSVNIRNGNVNYDRRTLKGKSKTIHVAAVVGSAVASILVINKVLSK